MNKKYLNFRTDMADERFDTYKKVHNLSEIDGIKVDSKTEDNINITTVDVLNENGKEALLKDIGRYVTIEIPELSTLEEEEKNEIGKKLSLKITEMIGKDKKKKVLVVGLGNIYVTPDALGPKVVQNIEVTRHLLHLAKDLIDENTRDVSAISPGVLGTTGIETYEIVNSVTNVVKPDIIIAIDSLASGSIHRIGKTIQLSNTGITPGAGVRNKRVGLKKENLGVDVIAVGIPTVVDMATITNEAIDKLIENTKEEITNYSNNKENNLTAEIFEKLENETRYDMIANVLDTQNYIVTPKEVDSLIEDMANIISSGINMSM